MSEDIALICTLSVPFFDVIPGVLGSNTTLLILTKINTKVYLITQYGKHLCP